MVDAIAHCTETTPMAVTLPSRRRSSFVFERFNKILQLLLDAANFPCGHRREWKSQTFGKENQAAILRNSSAKVTLRPCSSSIFFRLFWPKSSRTCFTSFSNRCAGTQATDKRIFKNRWVITWRGQSSCYSRRSKVVNLDSITSRTSNFQSKSKLLQHKKWNIIKLLTVVVSKRRFGRGAAYAKQLIGARWLPYKLQDVSSRSTQNY